MSDAPKPCECPAAGFCQRHGVEKNATLHKLCQTNDAYRRAWDAKKMPFQRSRPVAVARKAKATKADRVTSRVLRQPGVGSKIKEIINAANIKVSGCACNSKAHEWDRNGVAWCKEHRDELAGWLESQAIAHEISLLSAGANLAASYPRLAARIAAAAAMHPLRLNHVAAVAIVNYAIDHAGGIVSEPAINLPVFMTAAPRDKTIQERSVRSVAASGLGQLTVCCEPGVEFDDLTTWYPGVVAIVHEERLGSWRNLVYALRQALRTSAQYVITMEDDVRLHPQLGAMLASQDWQWPSQACGCLQLHTSAKYRTKYRRGGRWKLKPSESFDMLGACALMLRRDAVESLVDAADTDGWRGDTGTEIADPKEKKAGDTWIGEVLTRAGFEIWIHNPSLAEHIGTDSTLDHSKFDSNPNRKTLDYPGDQTNLFSIFTPASKMKIVALYKTFDGGEFVDASLSSVYDNVDHIVMVHSDTSWLGEKGNTVRHRVAKWCEDHDTADKVHHVDVDLSSQEEQYRAGLEYISRHKLDYDVILAIDADEIWEDQYFERARRQMVDQPFPAYRCLMHTYLKTPFYRVAPPFGAPTAFLRDPTWLLKSPRACRAPALQLQNVWMHHYTYVRESRDAVERKLHQSGKADGGEMVVPNWMETVYDRMPFGGNLHGFVRWREVWNHMEKIWLPDVPPAMRGCELMKLWLPDGQLLDGEKSSIFRMAKGRNQAIDLGTYQGLSAVILGLACERVHTIDAYHDVIGSGAFADTLQPDRYDSFTGHSLEATQALCRRFGNMTCDQSDTIQAAKHWTGGPVDVLFVDADHSENGTLGNVVNWLHHMPVGGLILLHDNNDIHPGVQAAVARFESMSGLRRIDPGEYAGSLAAFEVASRFE